MKKTIHINIGGVSRSWLWVGTGRFPGIGDGPQWLEAKRLYLEGQAKHEISVIELVRCRASYLLD
jgi:hypothetical protein